MSGILLLTVWLLIVEENATDFSKKLFYSATSPYLLKDSDSFTWVLHLSNHEVSF